jgi:hypothetical protein
VTVNLTRRTAIDVSFDQGHSTESYRSVQQRFTLYEVQIKRTVHVGGNRSIFASIGGGGGVLSHEYPAYAYATPTGPVTVRPFSTRYSLASMVIGGGFDYKVAPLLAVRGTMEFRSGSESAGIGFRLGAQVPLGRYTRTRAAAIPLGSPLARVRFGETTWITTADGQVLKGDVRSISASTVELEDHGRVKRVDLADIRTIEGVDPVGNGAKRGFIAGALATAIPSALFLASYCDGDCGGGEAVLFIAAISATSGTFGAIVGALIDSFREGRQVLYSATGKSPAIQIAPFVTGRTAGVGARVRW